LFYERLQRFHVRRFADMTILWRVPFAWRMDRMVHGLGLAERQS
jgi:hypothetical protein